MMNWYGWFIEQSFDSQEIFNLYKTVKMKSEEENWKEHIVEIPEEKLDEVISWLEEHLRPSWYAHIVKNNENEMVVVYKNKNFRLTNKSSFSNVMEYGRNQNIPENQLPTVGLFNLARKFGL